MAISRSIMVNLSELEKIINRKYQTLSYFGIEKNELNKFILDSKPNGIDRIVPIGRTSTFPYTGIVIILLKAYREILKSYNYFNFYIS